METLAWLHSFKTPFAMVRQDKDCGGLEHVCTGLTTLLRSWLARSVHLDEPITRYVDLILLHVFASRHSCYATLRNASHRRINCRDTSPRVGNMKLPLPYFWMSFHQLRMFDMNIL